MVIYAHCANPRTEGIHTFRFGVDFKFSFFLFIRRSKAALWLVGQVIKMPLSQSGVVGLNPARVTKGRRSP